MDRLWQKRMIWEMAVRMIADALLANLALLGALAIRYLWLIGVEDGAAVQTTLRGYIQGYRSSVWLLTLVSLVVFYASGFYTRGRMYRGRYKALVIAQAVILSYLIFGSLAFLFPQRYRSAAWRAAAGLAYDAGAFDRRASMVDALESHD